MYPPGITESQRPKLPAHIWLMEVVILAKTPMVGHELFVPRKKSVSIKNNS